MPDPKGTKSSDVLSGNNADNSIRGRQGNDTVSGGGGSDTFVFEKSFKENGMDTITDYHWTSSGSDGRGQDVLDLTEALQAFKRALGRDPNAQISDYVRLEYVSEGARLIVDTDGAGGQAAQQWALLQGITADDAVRVRAFSASGSGSGSGSGADHGNGYYTLGGPAPVSVLAIAANSADKKEGNSGLTAYTFTVTRTGSGSSSASWTVSGTGSDPADAADFENGVFPSGTVSFSGSETSKTITVYVKGDSTVEKDESFQVVLSAPATGTSLNPSGSSATGTIRNDDSLLSITATTADQDEGNSGTKSFLFTVTRTGDTSGTSSAAWAVGGGSGTNPADATDFGGTFPSGTVQFAADETTKTVTINVNGDTDIENDETFDVSLSSPSAGTSLNPSATSATGTIRNDDRAAATKIFVTSEAGPGLLAWFDSNGNGTLEKSEIDDPNNAASFGLGGNVDFANKSYSVEFIGISNVSGSFPAIDLNGFTDNDSLVVNFSQGWAGPDIASPAALQRGTYSTRDQGFVGYTYSNYTNRASSANMATRYQSKSFAIGTLKVGATIKQQSLFAGFQNWTSAGVVVPGGKLTAFVPSKLASWSSGTTIIASQLSVIWPDTLAAIG